MESGSAPTSSGQRARQITANDTGASPVLRRSVLEGIQPENAPNDTPNDQNQTPTEDTRKTRNTRSQGKAKAPVKARSAKKKSETEDIIIVSPPKKRRLSGESDLFEPKRTRMEEEMKGFMAEMRAKMGDLPTRADFSEIGTKIGLNAAGISNNKKRIDVQEDQIKAIKNSIERLEQEQIQATRGLAGKIERAVADGQGRSSVQTDSYTEARKSLRIWPIQGGSETELRKSLLEFLNGALDMSDDFEQVTIKRDTEVQERQSVVFDEVVVTFPTVALQDKVFLRGPKLAGFVDSQRKPKCGMRQEIPEHLMPSFRILHCYGMNLRRKVGNQVKKHIKFNDFTETLYIQVRIEEGGEWLSVEPEEAAETNKKQNNRRTERLRSLMAEGNEPRRDHPPRSVSESDVDMTERTESLWKPPARQEKQKK